MSAQANSTQNTSARPEMTAAIMVETGLDEGILRNLGVNVTSEPVYQSKKLYKKR